MLTRALATSAFLLTVLACRPEVGVVRPQVVRLPLGDSVLHVVTTQLHDTVTREVGMIYEYHPFFPLQDTIRLQAQARVVWQVVRSQADSLHVPFVVLRATSRTMPRGVSTGQALTYGWLIQKQDDGGWLLASTKEPF